jgi:hypothetical protein
MSDVPVQDHWDGRMTFLVAIAVQLLGGLIIYGFVRIVEAIWKEIMQ